MKNKRRLFLGLLSAATTIPLLPIRATPVPPESKSDIDALFLRHLLDIVPDNPSSRRIGRTLIDQSASINDPSTAFERLFAGWDRHGNISVDSLRHYLDAARRREFAAGDTVTVAGWILAQSEADAIAIATAYRSN